MKILVVEDESKIVSLIKRGLEEDGHEISVAMDGETGLSMARNHPFDLIVLDLMLPDVNGLEVCKRLRGDGITSFVIMLTALSSTENIVHGLDVGADDYLGKPFRIAELQARVRTLARRANTIDTANLALLKIADLVLDVDKRVAFRADEKINLTATEYRLLEFMIKNKNKVLSRIEILEQVWDINFNMGTNVVDVYVNYLRKKVDRNHPLKLIHTKIGMGYVIKEG